jgi:anti-anti-sigma factor
MTHSIRTEDGSFGTVVVVCGDADTHAAEALDRAIAAAAEEVTANRVIVDLLATNFVDSRTIGTLVSWTSRLEALGGALPIVCTDANILRLFRQIGLEQTLDLHASQQSAATGR